MNRYGFRRVFHNRLPFSPTCWIYTISAGLAIPATFLADVRAALAQWQSDAFVKHRSWVQPPEAAFSWGTILIVPGLHIGPGFNPRGGFFSLRAPGFGPSRRMHQRRSKAATYGQKRILCFWKSSLPKLEDELKRMARKCDDPAKTIRFAILRKSDRVERRRVELPTFALRTRRSPS